MSADLEKLEDEVTRLKHAMWGVMGDNGVVTDVRVLIAKFDTYIAAERQRRDDETKDQRTRDRAALLAAVTSVIAAIGIIVTLVVVLTTTGP